MGICYGFFINLSGCWIKNAIPGIFQRGSDSSDKGAKMGLARYYKWGKFPKKTVFTFLRVVGMLLRDSLSPLTLPKRHPCLIQKGGYDSIF